MIERIEKLFGDRLSDNFLKFWEEYHPGSQKRLIPTFELVVRKLNGNFGGRLPRLGHKRGWLIEIEDSLPLETKEITFAHELCHLSLDVEGYPLIIQSSETRYAKVKVIDDIASELHSIMVHPIIWLRLQEHGFPVNEHIHLKSDGKLSELRTIDRFPPRSHSPEWERWVLRYCLARLEWAEDHSREVYEFFKRKGSSIGDNGEKILKMLADIGYDSPSTLSPSVVKSGGDMILRKLKLNDVLSITQFKVQKAGT